MFVYEEEKRYLDLQLFADNLEDVEDDDPNKADLDDVDGDDDDGKDVDEEDFEKLAAQGAIEDEEDEPEDEGEPKVKAKETVPKSTVKDAKETPPVTKEETAEKLFTKEQVEALINERLARDPYRAIGRRLEQKTGMTLQQLDEYADRQQEEEEVKKYAEDNMVDEDEARKQVRILRENRELKARLANVEGQLPSYQRTLDYINDKARDINNPYVRKYEKEIDAFAQNGRACSFEAAKNYILGQKILSGELAEAIKSGAINKTLADIKKQSKVKVQSGSYSGKSISEMAADEVDPFQKQIAAMMGVPLKEVIAEKAKIQRERRSGRM